MSTTTDLRHAECPRCGSPFCAEEGYHMIDSYDRPPEADLRTGNIWDLHITLCRGCHLELLRWLYPNATSWEDLGERLRTDAVGDVHRLTR